MPKIIQSDAGEFLKNLDPYSIDLLVTSPPYWCQRIYGSHPDEIGCEPRFSDYINNLVNIFNLSKKCMKPTGWIVINIGDTYFNQPGQARTSKTSMIGNSPRWGEFATTAPKRDLRGLPIKSQAGIPERFKIAMIDQGWRCRNTIIWNKPHPSPTSSKDRWAVAYEVIHCFSVSEKSYFNKTPAGFVLPSPSGDVWTHSHRHTQNNRLSEEHPSVMPEAIVQRLVAQLAPESGTVIDPFAGSGTVLVAAAKLGRTALGCDLYNWESKKNE
jgi:site-specific DNA-methyltransferase (adenine-specific)